MILNKFKPKENFLLRLLFNSHIIVIMCCLNKYSRKCKKRTYIPPLITIFMLIRQDSFKALLPIEWVKKPSLG